MKRKNKYLLVIAGPTAIGKTAFSIAIAKHFGTEIISADSRQFYREMRIGTAYPEPEELAVVKHHFVGNLSIEDHYNVSRYESDVLGLLEELYQSHDIVVITGGSGLYLDAVCRGIDELPDPDPALRQSLKDDLSEMGIGVLQRRLQELDPEYYEIVDLNNPKRLLRALEVCIQTGQTYSSLRMNTVKPRPFNIIKIGLNTDRDLLFKRIGERVDKMMEKGLLDEVKSLLPLRENNALNTVGYKELFAYFDGDVSLEQAIENIKTNTRRYAKRQLTWFKRDQEIKWFEPEGLEEVLAFVESRLGESETKGLRE
jgi:tRNA dimethylallyltransferase